MAGREILYSIERSAGRHQEIDMKIIVDRALCEANGVCVRAAPDVFLLDEEDHLHLLVEEATPEQRARVEKAVRDCPRRALSLSER
jgi:ferredoxin